jgi:hypothetical protein
MAGRQPIPTTRREKEQNMHRIKIVGLALVAVLAMSALVASTASAKESKNLVIRDPSGVVAPGTTLNAASTNLVTVTAAGNLECEHALLPVTLTTNSATKDLGTSATDLNYGDYLGNEGACKTSAAGPALITSSAFPWLASFSNKGAEIEKGTKKVTFTSTFLGLAPPNKCTFEAAKLLSAFPVGKEGKPVPLVFTTKNQPFKLNKKAAGTSAICPSTGSLSGEWTVTDAKGTVSVEL